MSDIKRCSDGSAAARLNASGEGKDSAPVSPSPMAETSEQIYSKLLREFSDIFDALGGWHTLNEHIISLDGKLWDLAQRMALLSDEKVRE